MNGDYNESFFALYKLLFMMGVIERKEDIIPGFRYKNSRITLAIPNAQFGIAFQGDKVSELVDDGWRIERLTTHDLDPFLRVFDICDDARIALEKRKMDPNVKMTSQPEEVVLHEIMRRMLPIPDRNYKFTREDGTELTTPDFTWENYKIAFFLDGSYWHSIKGNKEIIKKIKADKKKQNDIVIQRSDKARKDGQIRSELGSMGWIVLSCTDGDVETQDGVNRVVDLIERTINNVQMSNQMHVGNAITQEEDDLFSSIFDASDNSTDSEDSQVSNTDNNNDQENTYNVDNDSQEEQSESPTDNNQDSSQHYENQESNEQHVQELDSPTQDAYNTNTNDGEEESTDTDSINTDKNSEIQKNPQHKLKGSIFDYIGDYEHEDEEISAEETNNYSPAEETSIDVSDIAESDIDFRNDPFDDYDVNNHDDQLDENIQDEDLYEEYDMLDGIFDDDLEDIFFIEEE